MRNTNNGTERINEELKYENLDRCTNYSLSELLTIIIEELLPRRYEKYVINPTFQNFCEIDLKL